MPYVGKAGEPATNSHRRLKVETVATMADISTYNFTSPKSTWPTFTAQRKMRIGSTRTHAPTLYPFLRLSIARGHTSKPNPSILINHGQFRTLFPHTTTNQKVYSVILPLVSSFITANH